MVVIISLRVTRSNSILEYSNFKDISGKKLTCMNSIKQKIDKHTTYISRKLIILPVPFFKINQTRITAHK